MHQAARQPAMFLRFLVSPSRYLYLFILLHRFQRRACFLRRRKATISHSPPRHFLLLFHSSSHFFLCVFRISSELSYFSDTFNRTKGVLNFHFLRIFHGPSFISSASSLLPIGHPLRRSRSLSKQTFVSSYFSESD